MKNLNIISKEVAAQLGEKLFGYGIKGRRENDVALIQNKIEQALKIAFKNHWKAFVEKNISENEISKLLQNMDIESMDMEMISSMFDEEMLKKLFEHFKSGLSETTIGKFDLFGVFNFFQGDSGAELKGRFYVDPEKMNSEEFDMFLDAMLKQKLLSHEIKGDKEKYFSELLFKKQFGEDSRNDGLKYSETKVINSKVVHITKREDYVGENSKSLSTKEITYPIIDLELLKLYRSETNGKKNINDWMREKLGKKPKDLLICVLNISSDKEGLDLSKMNLQGVYIQKFDVTGANLQDTNFKDCDIKNFKINGCLMGGCDFRGADISELTMDIGEKYWSKTPEHIFDEKNVEESCKKPVILPCSNLEKAKENKIIDKDFVRQYSNEKDKIGDYLAQKYKEDSFYAKRGTKDVEYQLVEAKRDDLVEYVQKVKERSNETFVDFIKAKYSKKGEIRVKLSAVSPLEGMNFTNCNFDYVDFSGIIITSSKDKPLVLENTSFFGACLEGMKFPENVKMKNCVFAQANMQYVNMQGATLDSCDFSYANISAGNFSNISGNSTFFGAQLINANFSGAKLENSDLNLMRGKKASFARAHLEKCKLKGANLAKSILSESYWDGCNLNKAIIDKSDSKSAKFKNSVLDEIQAMKVDFENSVFELVTAKGANFSESDMEEIKVMKSKFDNAVLELVNAKESEWNKVSLECANAQGANFEKSVLKGIEGKEINLAYASLEQAKIEKSNLEKATCEHMNAKKIEMHEVFMQEANLNFAEMEKAILEEVNLEKAKIENANIKNAKLDDVNLKGAEFNKGTDLTGTSLDKTEADQELKDHKYNFEKHNRFFGQKLEITVKKLYQMGKTMWYLGKAMFNSVKGMLAGALIGVLVAASYILFIAPAAGIISSAIILGTSLATCTFIATAIYGFVYERESWSNFFDAALELLNLKKEKEYVVESCPTKPVDTKEINENIKHVDNSISNKVQKETTSLKTNNIEEIHATVSTNIDTSKILEKNVLPKELDTKNQEIKH